MRLHLLFHGRMPSEKAAALWAAKTAEALGESGAKVVLAASSRGVKDDPFSAYGLKRNFSFIRLAVPDVLRLPLPRKLVFGVSVLWYALASLAYLLRHAKKDDIVFSNEPLCLLLASYFFPNCVYEMHVFPERGLWLYRKVIARMRAIVAINHWLADETARVFAYPRERIAVAPSGVDIAQFAIAASRSEARRELSLPDGAHIALYTGHLYAWKGVDTLAKAAALMPDTLVVFVGGTAEDVAAFKKKYEATPNIRVVGHVPHAQVPLWQKAADVLVFPNTAREKIAKYYTSPMKLFEYMASGTPIIASRLPSVQEILSDETATLVEPDDPAALAEAVQKLINESALAEQLASAARNAVERYSWQARAKAMLAPLR